MGGGKETTINLFIIVLTISIERQERENLKISNSNEFIMETNETVKLLIKKMLRRKSRCWCFSEALQSDNLPRVDAFMVASYLAINSNFVCVEMKGTKANLYA